MNASAVSLLAIFEKKIRLEVPLFQRQYVWDQDRQWEPLWDDISRKFSEYIEGQKERPIHFLGAMVLDQKQTPVAHVERRQIIDGQQRLTTLQLFLAAFRDYCIARGFEELGGEADSYTINKGMMADPTVDQFKVWPTLLDRKPFRDVIAARSKEAVLGLYPLKFRKYARRADPRPRIVEAYLYFYDRLREFFEGMNGDEPIASSVALPIRLEECFQSLRNALQVVAIDLDLADDAQVIFETLNARGEPLLPADLLRNYIFLRAARLGEPQEQLYADYWQQFDDSFWRQEVRQGRLKRPRSDLFMQHFLSSRQGVDIPIKHLFVEYKYWIERKKPFESVRDELATLATQGDDFRRIIAPARDDQLYSLSTFLDVFDVRTAYPLLLAIMADRPNDEEVGMLSQILESYLVRRAICGLTTKNYNRVFLQSVRALRGQSLVSTALISHLASLGGDSTVWPRDEMFREAWLTNHIYQVLNNPKIVYILRKLNESYVGVKSERVEITSQLSVEHILPQAWVEHWPLPSGEKGMSLADLSQASPDDTRAAASRRRNMALHTLGNLTILSQPLNSAVSNGSWKNKKTEILKYSLLPINLQLGMAETWDETAIRRRGEDLLNRAIALWAPPPVT